MRVFVVLLQTVALACFIGACTNYLHIDARFRVIALGLACGTLAAIFGGTLALR